MRTIALVLAALALAGCSTSSRPAGSATLTLFGTDPRLESWRTSVAEGLHVHAAAESDPCSVAVLSSIVGATTAKLVGGPHERVEELTRAMQGSCPLFFGPAYGGPESTAVVLRRFREGVAGADEALIVVLPRIKPDETDRLFRAGEFSATFEKPLKTAEAVLDHGWVRAFRSPGGRTEFELFLVLKPAQPGASYESLQVVTRVNAPAR